MSVASGTALLAGTACNDSVSMALYLWCGLYLLIVYSQVVPQVLEESRKHNMHVHISLSQMAVTGRTQRSNRSRPAAAAGSVNKVDEDGWFGCWQ